MTESPAPRSKGEVYEGIAFTFCKAATIILLTQKYALLVASGAAVYFYVMADVNGYRQTRCFLGPPRVVAAFWSAVFAVSVYLMVRSW